MQKIPEANEEIDSNYRSYDKRIETDTKYVNPYKTT